MAKNVVVVGTQWGDEGKGKIVDWLTNHAKGVVRFQGGHNAGHTLVVGEKVYKLNLVPSGIVRAGVNCYIGNGVVLDIHHLLAEINELEAGGIESALAPENQPGLPADRRLPLGARSCARSLQVRRHAHRHNRQGHWPGLRGQGRAPARCASMTCSIRSASRRS